MIEYHFITECHFITEYHFITEDYQPLATSGHRLGSKCSLVAVKRTTMIVCSGMWNGHVQWIVINQNIQHTCIYKLHGEMEEYLHEKSILKKKKKKKRIDWRKRLLQPQTPGKCKIQMQPKNQSELGLGRSILNGKSNNDCYIIGLASVISLVGKELVNLLCKWPVPTRVKAGNLCIPHDGICELGRECRQALGLLRVA
jgi:hypothetical protein